jgi:hypothetical protein
MQQLGLWNHWNNSYQRSEVKSLQGLGNYNITWNLNILLVREIIYTDITWGTGPEPIFRVLIAIALRETFIISYFKISGTVSSGPGNDEY